MSFLEQPIQSGFNVPVIYERKLSKRSAPIRIAPTRKSSKSSTCSAHRLRRSPVQVLHALEEVPEGLRGWKPKNFEGQLELLAALGAWGPLALP